MADNKPFSEYLTEARAKRGTSLQPTKRQIKASPTAASVAPVASGGGGNDFWSTAIDILMRPAYAVSNVPNQILNEIEKSKIEGDKFDVAGAWGNVLSSPIRGLFSTDPADKTSYAQLIEKTSDVAHMDDPSYKDVENNVDPVLAGTLGFVGDVALDPLTWIPVAGWAAKGLKAGGKALGLGAKSAEEATALAVAAEKELKGLSPVSDGLPQAEDLASAYVTGNIKDIKTPKADAMAEEVFTSSNQAKNAATATAAKDLAPDLAAQVPSKAVPESLDKIISEAPKFGGTGRSRIGEIGNLFANIRKGEHVAPKKAPKLWSQTEWRERVRTAINTRVAQGTATAKEIKFLETLRDPQKLAYHYKNMYKKGFDANNGDVNLFGAPIKPTSGGFTDKVEWLQSLRRRGNNEYVAKYPKIKSRPQGATHLTPSQAEEAISAGSIDGVRITKEMSARISKEVEAAFKEVNGPAVVSGEVAGNANLFSSTLKNLLDSDADIKRLFGPKLSAALRNMSDEKLDASAKILEDIASGQKSMDNIVDWSEESGASTIKQMAKLLGEDTGDARLLNVEDIPAYNLARRKAMSEVNEAPYVNDMAEGKTIFDSSYVPSDAASRLSKWLPSWIKERVALSKMEFETRNKIKTSSPTMGKGKAFDPRMLNNRDAWDLAMAAMDFAIKDAKRMKMGASARANYVRQTAMRELAMAEKLLDEHGVQLWLGGEQGGKRFLLSPSQVVAAMWDADKDLTNMLLFNADTLAPITYMFDALTESMSRGKPLTRERLIEIITGESDKAYSAKIGRAHKIPGFNKEAGKVTQFKGFLEGGVYGRQGQKSVRYSSETLINRFEASMPRVVENLAQTVNANEKYFAARYPAETRDLFAKRFEELAALAADDTRIADTLRNVDKLVDNVSRDSVAGAAMDVSALRAVELGQDVIPEATQRFARNMAKSEKAMADAAAENLEDAAKPFQRKREDIANEEYNKWADEAEKTDPNLLGDTPIDRSNSRITGEIQANVAGFINPTSNIWNGLRSRFSRFYNQEHVANLAHSATVLSRTTIDKLAAELKAFAQKYPQVVGNESIINKIFSDLQHGVVNPQYSAAVKELQNLLGRVNNVGFGGSFMDDPFFRNAQGIEKLNEYFAKAGLGDEHMYDINKALNDVKEGKYKNVLEAASNQWREKTIADPLRYIDERNVALTKLAQDQGISASFRKMAVREGLVSDVAKPGYMKPTGLQGTFFDFLPDDVYYNATILKELKYLGEHIGDPRRMQGRIGEIINKYLLPVQGSWMYGITILRPGHHVRNLIGQLSLIFMAEGARNFRKAANMALRMMSVRKSYEGVDMFKALREGGINDIPKGTDTIANIKGVNISNNWLYDTMSKEGLFPTYSNLEGLYDDAIQTNKLSELMDRLLLRGGKIERAAGGLSEYRDHAARSHHFIQILLNEANNPKFKNIDELVDYASKRVKKFNPDSSQLTSWEARNMRTIIPFYSWFRGALPSIIEATITNPARFTMFSKASFNMAYAMGVNPYSVYDPFPSNNDLFPSFLTEQIQGPIMNINGNFIGANPGIAAWDVYNQLSTTNPVQAVAGMTSPFLRIPFELLSGSTWGTGTKIKDTSDYIDASLPMVNYLSNITGTSVTGTPFSLLQGKGVDPQYQVAAGNKGLQDQLASLSNFFLGLGIANQSRPNFINYSEIEKRNAAAEDKRSGF